MSDKKTAIGGLRGPDPLRKLRELDYARPFRELAAAGAINRSNAAAMPGAGLASAAGTFPSAMVDIRRGMASYGVDGLQRPEVTEKMKRAAAIRAFGHLHLPPDLADEHARLVDSLAELVR